MAANGNGQTPDADTFESLVETGPKPDLPFLYGVEAIRKRPAMYIGSVGVGGLHSLITEIIDNSINEVFAGHCSRITVTLEKDHSVTVEDNGRGIPVDSDPQTGTSFVESVMTELFAGDKFGHLVNENYRTTGNRCGVGAICVNALSEWMETTVRRDGGIYRMRCERGILVEPLEVIGTCRADEQGTTQCWMADRAIFHDCLTAEGELDYRTESLVGRIREISFLTKEVEITFIDTLHEAAPAVYHSPQGVAPYLAFLNEGKVVLYDKIACASRQQGKDQVEIALQYTRDPQETMTSFVNNVPLSAGGGFLVDFYAALTSVINRYVRENGLLRSNHADFTDKHVRVGLTAIISIRLSEPLYLGPGRQFLHNPEAGGIVKHATAEGVTQFLTNNPEVACAILEQINNNRRK